MASGVQAQEEKAGSETVERLAPKTAFLSFGTNDASQAAEGFGNLPLGKLLASPTWRPYFAAMGESHTASPLHMRPWFGIDWQDLAEFPLPACLIAFGDAQSKSAIALIVDVTKQPTAAQDLRDRATNYFRGRTARVVEETLAEGTRTNYSLTPAAGTMPKYDVVCLVRKDRLAFVTSRQGADDLLAFWDAKSPSLVELPEFQQVQRQSTAILEQPSHLRWWVRPLDLIRAIPKPRNSGQRGQRNWASAAERQGIGGIQAMGGTIRFSGDGPANAEISLVALTPSTLEGAIRLASLQPGERREPPQWAASSVNAYSDISRDVERWFSGLGSAFDEAGNELGAFQDFLQKMQLEPDGPRINVRREIVSTFEPHMAVLSDHGGEKSEWNLAGRRDLLVLDVKNGPALEKVFLRWFAVDVEDQRVRREVVAGRALWASEPGRPLFIDTGGEPERRLTCLALQDNKLLLSTDESWLREILAGKRPNSALVADRQFLAAMAYLQAEESKDTALRAFTRDAENWEFPYQKMRDSKPASDLSSKLLVLLLFGGTDAPPPGLTGALPEWKDVAPALGTTATSIRQTTAGFTGVLGLLPK